MQQPEVQVYHQTFRFPYLPTAYHFLYHLGFHLSLALEVLEGLLYQAELQLASPLGRVNSHLQACFLDSHLREGLEGCRVWLPQEWEDHRG
jgi:hypothetical protein